MDISDKYLAIVRRILPSPFAIALLLSFLIFCIALIFNAEGGKGILTNAFEIGDHWYAGLWNTKLLAFTVQMMLILVLGHVLALSDWFDRLMNKSLAFCTNTATAAAVVAFMSMLVALFNWGLGLIFGAILARKVGEYASKKGIPLNYPLIGAAAYTGLMVWHGGLSGSAPLTVATENHSFVELMGVIPASETVFSTLNLIVSLLILSLVPACFYLLGKREPSGGELPVQGVKPKKDDKHVELVGAERMDHASWPALITGGSVLVYCAYLIFVKPEQIGLDFLNLNFINLLLLGLGLIAHRNLVGFLKKIDEAISDVAGILVQFPLYFGIMGIMMGSGLVEWFSEGLTQFATAQTLPILTFFSAGLVNVFIPSGGGQWQVQGPIIIAAADGLQVAHSKMVMALAYGDQLTNMLQPFWALPLLGITGLKAKEILPYTVLIMLVGGLIFGVSLWLI